MLAFLNPHFVHQGSSSSVGRGKLLEMPRKVFFDLTLGFGEKRQVPAIAQ